MNELLTSLRSVSESMTAWFVWMNLWCAAMLIAAFVLDRALAKRVSATWRMWLYVAILARLALPLSLETPVGIVRSDLAPVRIALGDPGMQAREAVDPIVMEGASAPAAAGPREWWSPTHLALPIYMGGVTILLAVWHAGARRLARIVAQSRPSETVRTPTGTPVLEHADVGPALIGIFRPRLVIPADLETRAGRTGLGWVLKHESAHVSRRDPITATLLHIIVIAAWPVGAVWFAAARVRGLLEEACDARALRGACAADREDYGRTLIELAGSGRIAKFAPSLRFGTGLRSRVRALASASHWPVPVQAVLAALLSAMLIACASSRSSAPVTLLNNAESDPFKGSLPIRVTILRSWPKHPKLDYFLGQVDGEPEPDSSINRLLTREEFAEILSGAEAADAGAVISRPRIEVLPGVKASMSVGVQTLNGTPTSGFTLDSTVNRVAIPAGSSRRVYTMNIDFNRFGDAATASSASMRGTDVPQGQTLALLASGNINGEKLLVCITPGPDESTSRFGNDPLGAGAVTESRSQITFTARIHRVDAPKDYGSPKGDRPRKNWSAYPGGMLLSAADFAAYQTEIRSRPGYVLLSAPRVTVYPDQEATIETRPEPTSPGATQTIRVRGTPDGAAVLCMGSYVRSNDGMTTEGSWNRPTAIEPDGAMVWSIHDAEHGAWYTMTLQAHSYKVGSIKPQTATMPIETQAR